MNLHDPGVFFHPLFCEKRRKGTGAWANPCIPSLDNLSYDKRMLSERVDQSAFQLLPFDIAELPEDEQEQWEKFVSGPLSETNKKNTVDLVSPSLSLYCISTQAFHKAG